ncbi:MAG: helix-hairpin-helix domain-containing protein [Bacteroidota bacterium]
MWRRVRDWLALTATERKVMLFLGATFLAGSGIRLYQAAFPERRTFDYSASDSTFAALSERIGEAEDEEEGSGKRASPGRPVNLNTATKRELMTLPGIGEIMAERILLHRQDHGEFRRPEDLLNVRGIGKKRLEEMKTLITVN